MRSVHSFKLTRKLILKWLGGNGRQKGTAAPMVFCMVSARGQPEGANVSAATANVAGGVRLNPSQAVLRTLNPEFQAKMQQLFNLDDSLFMVRRHNSIHMPKT